MYWKKSDIENYLGIKATEDGTGYVFVLPIISGSVTFGVYPEDDRIQVIGKNNETLSASVHCKKIEINNDPPDEGGDCVVLSSDGGHVCISKKGGFFSFFFSMYQKNHNNTLN
jgi:hypothetical protein